MTVIGSILTSEFLNSFFEMNWNPHEEIIDIELNCRNDRDYINYDGGNVLVH